MLSKKKLFNLVELAIQTLFLISTFAIQSVTMGSHSYNSNYYCRERCTFVECTLGNIGDGIGNGDRTKTLTSVECTGSHFCDELGNGNCCQTFAVHKCTFRNGSNSLGNGISPRQTTGCLPKNRFILAVHDKIKGIPPNVSNTVRQFNGF